MTWTVEKANAVFQELKERASKDDAFRELALNNPEAALKELTGLGFPEGVNVTLSLDENGEIVAQTMMAEDPDQDRELDDAELEAVSGGTSFSAFILYGPPYPPRSK